ncbi:hypothetical protein O3G_MSEX013650 [Manduca sexta]|uniref:Uncharacterized protein n=1 Tax=Manduca sexta TaxID=7130 RepID=A0A921ZSJ7_MANSE|nr:hypothetical protein O3G_MSEX013650 [Manduca sexta]
MKTRGFIKHTTGKVGEGPAHTSLLPTYFIDPARHTSTDDVETYLQILLEPKENQTPSTQDVSYHHTQANYITINSLYFHCECTNPPYFHNFIVGLIPCQLTDISLLKHNRYRKR